MPVDPALSEAEILNIARRSEPRVLLVSDDVARDFAGLHAALAEAGLPTQVHSLAQAMEGDAPSRTASGR